MPSRHAAARAGEVAAIEPPTTPFVQPEDLPIWPVPASLRREGPLGGPEPSYIKSLGLAEVFEAHDGPKLAELFDTDSVFRCVICSFPPPFLPHQYRPLTATTSSPSQACHPRGDAR